MTVHAGHIHDDPWEDCSATIDFDYTPDEIVVVDWRGIVQTMRYPLAGKADRVLVNLMVLLPVASLSLMCLAWLRYGVDLPTYDDWRDYAIGKPGSLEPSHLFTPANDTLYPVGRLLDSLAFRYLDGNSVAYQLLSMSLVLGLCLFLQWRLLTAVFVDRLLAACCFVVTLLLLNPSTYWGGANLAYHQAIPVVCLLATAYLAVVSDWRLHFKSPLLLAITLISGLSYISGAFATLAGALALLAMGAVFPRFSACRGAALVVGAGALITSAMQAYVIVVVQHGNTHRADAPWTSPLGGDFWLYGLGVAARSLGLPRSSPLLSLILVSAILAAFLALVAVATFRRPSETSHPDRDTKRLAVTVFLLAAVATYLSMVAAGRASLRPPEIPGGLNLFDAGYRRFYFFWVAMIWPWALAAVLYELSRVVRPQGVKATAIVFAVVFVGWSLGNGSLNYMKSFAAVGSRMSKGGIECLQQQLATSDKLYCPHIFPTKDMTKAYLNGALAGASYARHVPPNLRSLNSSPDLDLFTPAALTAEGLALTNADLIGLEDGGIEIDARPAPSLVFSTMQPDRMKSCRTLLLEATVTGAEREVARLYVLPKGATNFSNRASAWATVNGQEPVRIVVSDAGGFEDRVRFDPISGAGRVRVSGLKVRCLFQQG